MMKNNKIDSNNTSKIRYIFFLGFRTIKYTIYATVIIAISDNVVTGSEQAAAMTANKNFLIYLIAAYASLQ